MALRSGVLDASVLYVESIRSLLLWIATEGGLAPFWTERILEETRNNLIEGDVIGAEQWTEAELLGLLAGLGHGDAQAPVFARAAAAAFSVIPARPPLAR